MHIVKSIGVWRVGANNGRAVRRSARLRGIGVGRAVHNLSAVPLIAPQLVKFRVGVAVQDARTVAPLRVPVTRAGGKLPLRLRGEVEVEARLRTELSKEG